MYNTNNMYLKVKINNKYHPFEENNIYNDMKNIFIMTLCTTSFGPSLCDRYVLIIMYYSNFM